ncbi:MAG: SRPBCC domain-containing protein [Phycisphaerales bacterium]|nr:SRPBCC domain-containing protein [Phycisphaerales bacterium]
MTPGLGGRIFLSWGAFCEGEAEITAWEPPRRFGWTENVRPNGDATSPSARITAEFTLEPRGSRTAIRVVQAGFTADADWSGYIDSISRGWRFELRGLRHYLERHRSTPRRVVWARHATELSPTEVAGRVLGPAGRVLRGALDGLVEGSTYSWEWVAAGSAPPCATLVGEVCVSGLPASFAGTFAALQDAYFRFEVERMGGAGEAWLWFSTYGIDERTLHAWQAYLDRALARALQD